MEAVNVSKKFNSNPFHEVSISKIEEKFRKKRRDYQSGLLIEHAFKQIYKNY